MQGALQSKAAVWLFLSKLKIGGVPMVEMPKAPQ
jgi:hypothetical protein